MADIYIHIPFCKQACHYCDFHFSTSLIYKSDLINALHQEIRLQKNFLNNETIETIYFGGGTPSLLDAEEVNSLIDTITNLHTVSPDAEITLEAYGAGMVSDKIMTNSIASNFINAIHNSS